MNNKKFHFFSKIPIIILLFGFFYEADAQQDEQYTQYMYNIMSYNPAYAGARDVVSILGIHRNQWVGVEGAPITNSLSIHSPVGTRVGLGVNLFNDRIGPMDNSNLSANFSYTIDFNDDRYKLAFGLSGSIDLLNVDFTKLNIHDPSEDKLQYNIENRLSPNFGVGLFLYSDSFYAGISVPEFLETKHYDKYISTISRENMHFYLTSGYVFELNRHDIKLKPAILLKAAGGAPLQTDVSFNVLFNEQFTVGTSYRFGSSISALVGMQVSEKIFVGYSYDADTTKLMNYSSGSHEIFLRFELFNRYTRVNNPRFF